MASNKKMKKGGKSSRRAKESDAQTASKLLAEIDAMSSDEESYEEGAGGGSGGIVMKGNESDDSEEEYDRNAEARALRQAIKEGVFDKLAKLTPGAGADDDSDSDDDNDADDNQKKKKTKNEFEEVEDESNSDDDEEEEEEELDDENSNGEESEEEDESGNDGKDRMMLNPNYKALRITTEELEATKDRLAWPEQFTVIPSQVLPFHDKANRLDIHDDLKREVAFYDLALEAVQLGKQKCKQYGIPFTRPNDFLAEMIKTDEHMAKVKDRLIFEGKKIAAVEQRRNNKQHKARAKEIQQQKLLEKNQRKKEHMQKLSEWSKSAAQNRRGSRMVGGREDDEAYLSRFDGSGKSAKRKAADRKYGHGKKSRLARKPDSKSLNDMSGYSKQVYERKMKKGSSPAKRPGKRARDAVRARKK